jgi:polysaccharide pyruvyl transferase WcaK-like protein
MAAQGVRRRLGALRRGLGFGRVALRRSVTAYVGWLGEGNVGDEAMFQAHRELLPELDFVGVPAAASTRMAKLAGSVPWLSCRAVCLGGGTLVGNGHFRRALENAVAAWPRQPRFTLGVGVEDPGYRVGLRSDVIDELERWRPLLEGFRYLGVRGPLSAAALAELGVESQVVGDPALALRPPTSAPERGLLGLNLGTVDDQWGQDPEGFRRGALELARGLVGDGWRIVMVPTWSADVEFQRSLAEEVGGVETMDGALGVDAVAGRLARCEVVVAHKLHAAVLAAAVEVPAIALEYRPKCRDFQESVGRGRFVMRTDRLDTATVRDWAREASTDGVRQRQDLARRVEDLRGRLEAATATVREAIATGR